MYIRLRFNLHIHRIVNKILVSMVSIILKYRIILGMARINWFKNKVLTAIFPFRSERYFFWNCCKKLPNGQEVLPHWKIKYFHRVDFILLKFKYTTCHVCNYIRNKQTQWIDIFRRLLVINNHNKSTILNSWRPVPFDYKLQNSIRVNIL